MHTRRTMPLKRATAVRLSRRRAWPMSEPAYASVLRKLIQRQCVTPGIQSTKALLAAASGDAWYPRRVIHVAGTNGKGSTCSNIARVLNQVAGWRVGAFTSPHALSVRERIAIQGVCISDADFVELHDELEEVITRTEGLHVSFFELLTVMALAYFHRGPTNQTAAPSAGAVTSEPYCDVMVLETGLGGELDATNVVRDPICTVITSIGWDHMAVLGNTLEEIASQKAGILKPRCPVVLGPQALGYHAIDERIRISQCRPVVHVAPGPETETIHEENTRIAKAALDIVLGESWYTPEAAACLRQAPPFRAQRLAPEEARRAVDRCAKATRSPPVPAPVAENIPIYLDVGHNATALARIARDLRHMYPTRTFRVGYCISTGRSLSMVLPLVNELGSALMVRMNPRATPPRRLM